MRFPRSGRLQERQELPGDRDVDPAHGGGHRLDQRSLGNGPFDGGPLPLRSGYPGFAQANFGTACSTRVTTVLAGTTVRGFNSAASSRASCLDRPKNRGSTADRFSSVATEASTAAVVKQSFPSRIGSRTSGNRWTSQAAARR